ncbi:hypothetical protein BJ322DRAFT_1203429 [Thelephora terrestris]|uniref:GRIP domain-containing protein n=1 Tax=Thelephora terrestris TaxID=56493 RepID=A0A9P6L8I0_9AGAM|nr:hypothetical protein BJ322DRAFT_1203429 [Thelephora terrestris]
MDEHSNAQSPNSSSSISSIENATAALRLSVDSDRDAQNPSLTNGNLGGHAANNSNGSEYSEDSDLDPVERLQKELERTKGEKDVLASQYRTLLSKLTAMRTTLGNKLQQDAEELDRREQVIQQLTAEGDEFRSTVETLKAELISSNDEAERATRELEALRTRALHESAQESMLRERELRETQSELERCRIERDEWERALMQERVLLNEARVSLDALTRDLEMEQEARRGDMGALEVERERASNLQSVLGDFQAAKDHEIRQAVLDLETRYNEVTVSLADFKHRALTAELQLEENRSTSSKTQDLEKELKEKNLLIGKLRHEAVIMNEHLVEALRRLRRSSNNTNVDRRLVTNVLLQFLTTPRGDAKRFEMLTLLSSILQWSDDEREKAGLQRSGPPGSKSSILSTLSPASKSKALELEKTDETESFSRLWVEFLLTEAAAGETPSSSNMSLPGTPTYSPNNLPSPLNTGSPRSVAGGMRRLASFGASMSSPNLHRSPSSPPPFPPISSLDKGKGKDVG